MMKEINYTIAEHVNKIVCEPQFFIKVFEKIENYLDDTYHFIIGRTNSDEERLLTKKCIKPGKKKILIMLSDEAGIIPYDLDEYYMVYRTYSNQNLIDNKKVFGVPCGFSYSYGGLFGKSDWCYIDMETPKRKLIDREYDFFYSAQLSPNRVSCVNVLNSIKNKYKCIVNNTQGGFARGYELNEYYDIMQNSKIAIVPNGAVVPESFRYFEAFESNCIVITTYPKHIPVYNNWFYENSTAIFLNDWNDLSIDLVDSLLTEDSLKKYQIDNRNYFDKYLSTDAIMKYILKNIEKNEQ